MSKETKNTTRVEEPVSAYQQPLNASDIWALFQETDKRFRETEKRMKELQNLFTCQWGRLIESLVEGDLVKLLNQRNIPVSDIIQRMYGRRGQENYEFDIVAANGDVVVIVEVKTTLRPDDVKDFITKLKKVNTLTTLFRGMKIFGAVAFLTAISNSVAMAEKNGLFVIRATGSSSSIINASEFEPRVF